jgi:hypothetical protein
VGNDRHDSVNPARRRFFKTCAAGTATAILASKPLFSGMQRVMAMPTQPASPRWAKDLIIYEIATKGFTSPNGPESGTFNSLRDRLPYLENLGITGIWLTGYSVCDAHHFYNVWTQYAVIEPGQIDPSLGSEKEFKGLIEEAHRRGIRVFLDVITHGLMPNSSQIARNPHWFRGGSWGMVDFDWYGGHTDLDDWWVKTWTDYVLKYGVDGFRLDVFIYRPDLWERTRQNAAAAGHSIVIFEEGDSPIPGVTDFSQHENTLAADGGSPERRWNKVLLQDVPGFYGRRFGKTGKYQVEIQYRDGNRVKGETGGEGTLRVRFDGLGTDKTTRRKQVFFAPMPDGIPDVQLTIENPSSRAIENIFVSDDVGGRWELHRTSGRHLAMAETRAVSSGPAASSPSLQVYVPTLAHGWPSVQLSCHDNGWQGFPREKNPYVAQGSRAMFGYSVLFTPMIPIFFSGEEFNASFRPIPWLSPYLYGGKDAGKGRWLYGAMIDWAELHDVDRHAMFKDVKAMIAIRRREADVLSVMPDKKEPNLVAVPHESDSPVPVPYLRWNRKRAILVAANPSSQDVRLKLSVPLSEIRFAGRLRYRVTGLWPRGETRTCTEDELASFTCTVKRDRSPGGGLSVFSIEPSV